MWTDGEKIWVYGGSTRIHPSNYGSWMLLHDIQEYDIAGDTWTERNAFDEPLTSAGGALRVVGIEDIEVLVDAAGLDLESADQSMYGYSSVIDGDYLYGIVEEENNDNRGLAIVDISDPLVPVQVGSLEGGVNTTTIGRAIWKDGDYVYAPSFATNGSLASINVSDPTTPVLTDELVLTYTTNPVNSEKMSMVWPRLYIPWENDLHIVDVSIPTALSLESTFTLPAGNLNNQCVLETDVILWVLDDAGILAGFNLENPAVPALIGGLVDATNLLNVEDFGIVQPYLYAVEGTSTSVIDLTDPSAPVLFATYSGFTGLKSFASSGGHVLFVGMITDGGIFYAGDQRANRYVDYDERPFEFDGEFDTDSRIYLQAQGPATILAITYDVEDSDNETDSDRSTGNANT
jgi:hypothetical protein